MKTDLFLKIAEWAIETPGVVAKRQPGEYKAFVGKEWDDEHFAVNMPVGYKRLTPQQIETLSDETAIKILSDLGLIEEITISEESKQLAIENWLMLNVEPQELDVVAHFIGLQAGLTPEQAVEVVNDYLQED